MISKTEGLGAAGGAIAGFWLGGPVGAVLGGLAGWAVGRAYGSQTAGSWSSLTDYLDIHGRHWQWSPGETPAPGKDESDWIRYSVDELGNRKTIGIAVRVKAAPTDWQSVGPLLDNA